MSKNRCLAQQGRFSRHVGSFDTDTLHMMSLVDLTGKRNLLEEIKGKCRSRHPWLKTEYEVELVALHFWAGRYYQNRKGVR